MESIECMKLGLRESDLSYVDALLRNFKEVEQAYLFGSRAKGTFRNGSDVDIALMGMGLSFTIVHQISYLLNEESPLPYHFDCVNFNTIENSALKEHIERVGIVVYTRARFF